MEARSEESTGKVDNVLLLETQKKGLIRFRK